MLFLQETRLCVRDVEKCKFNLEFPNCLAISATCRNGLLHYYGEGMKIYQLLITLLIILMLLLIMF